MNDKSNYWNVHKWSILRNIIVIIVEFTFAILYPRSRILIVSLALIFITINLFYTFYKIQEVYHYRLRMRK